jgi:hypothetical protein
VTPTEFKEATCVYAEDQPEYLPLPVHRTAKGAITACWKLGLWERLRLLFTGRLWLSVLTFNGPLQPLSPSASKPPWLTTGEEPW